MVLGERLLQKDSGEGEISIATLRRLLQKEGPLPGLVAWLWAVVVRAVLVMGGWAGLSHGSGSAAWLRLGSLGPGVILGSAWCDQHGHQSKTFILEAGTASLAMPKAVYIHVAQSDSSEPVVAAVALTEWICSHPSCHSASKNTSCLF